MFACLLIGAFGLFVQSRALDLQSRQFADQSALAVLGSWDEQDLLDRGAAQLIAAQTDAERDDLFAGWSQLGELRHYAGSRGGAKVTLTRGGALVTANYVGKAEFSHGNALVKLALVREKGAWRVLGFGVYPGQDALDTREASNR